MIPEIFLQHSSDMLSSHTNWIIHFVRYFEEKSFKVSDPFLGYCAAVVATIELQLSFTEDSAIRKDKQERFSSCVKFVHDLGEEWPHMAQMVCWVLPLTMLSLMMITGREAASFERSCFGVLRSLRPNPEQEFTD
jgi:hypothetical protein